MDSHELARYIETTNGLSKPWLLVQMRLKKLEEARAEMPREDYFAALADIHQDLMKLGEWWIGREAEVFGWTATDSTAGDEPKGPLS